MNIALLLLRAAVSFYVLATASAFASVVLKPRKFLPWTPLLAGIGFAAHLAHLAFRTAAVGVLPIGDTRDLLSLLCWAAVLVYLVSWSRTRLEVLGVVILPLVLVLLFISNILTREVFPVSRDLEGGLLNFHIVVAVMGVAALFLTFAASVIYLVQERGVKEKRPGRLGFVLPSLEKCDTLARFSMMWGFPLLTVSIITGAIWNANFRTHARFWESKESFALLAWLILGVIVSARYLRGWRGRKAAYLTILAFAALLLRMIGVYL